MNEHHTLVVANRTAAMPLLIEEVARRARERPTTRGGARSISR